MPTVQEIHMLVQEISSLSKSLPKSVPTGSQQDKLWRVMNGPEHESVFATFNRRFDALFAEDSDCRDANGRFRFLRKGKDGMNIVCKYLQGIKWASDLPLDLVEIKLLRVVSELRHLVHPYVSPFS